MKNKVKRNLISALTTLTIGGIATIPNFVFANTAVNTPGTVTDLVNGVAIGSNSDSKGTGISIGANAKTEQPIGAIAIGNNADAVTAQSIAIGDGAIAGKNDMDNPQNPNNRTTVGKRSNIAIGTGAVAEGGRNISIGENTGKGTIDNWNIHNVNIGTEASQNSKKDYSVSIGFRAGAITSDAAKTAQAGVADGNRAPSVYIGKEAGTDTAAYGNIGIGNGAGKGIIDTRTASSIMIGNGAGVGMTSNDGKNITFPGFGSGANILVGNASGRNLSGDGNVALGNIAGDGSKGDNNIYFGHLAGQDSTNDRSIIMGPQSGQNSTNDRAVLIGNFANGGVTQATRNVVGIGSSVQSTGSESTAIGFNAKAQADNTNVIGRFAIATAVDAIAIGTNAKVSGVRSIALGNGAEVSGKNSISIGTGNIVSGEGSAAIGDSSSISGTASYSVGNNNTISTNDTFVLGSNVTKTANNSVFFGKDAAYVADSATTKGLANDYTSETIQGLTYNYAGGTQNIGVVSVGNVDGTRRIQNVAPALISSTSTDAVNGSQLYDTNRVLGNVANQLYGTETRINRLGNRINHVGAGAAALAGLHPLDFDPDDKWDFAAGYGNYKNANAVAIGAYYRPNEDTMFSVGGSFSGGENMVNLGVSWKFGQKSHISRSRVSMAKDMLAMKNQIETLTKKLAAYESGQPVKLAPIATGAMTFPDVPENHWAYEYVKNLAERGYLKGYPEGEFKGDRAMTRYEYAAIIYRALQNGAPSDGNMTRSVDDFGPELVKVQNIDRFRVDRISGKDNDRHKVERVRVNDKDDKAQNVYRDVYGNHIQK